MAPRLRKMKTYRPRRRTKGLDLYKQSLHDLKHRISSNVGSLIVLFEEGNLNQITAAQQKAKSDFLKHASEMQKIAQKLGERYLRAVRDYLDSVDIIVHSNAEWLDEAKINNCYTMAEKLEKEISAA
jgi:intein-encoded DNA endonuclease-like protein